MAYFHILALVKLTEMVMYHVLLRGLKETSQSNIAIGYMLHLQHWIVTGIGFCMYVILSTLVYWNTSFKW